MTLPNSPRSRASPSRRFSAPSGRARALRRPWYLGIGPAYLTLFVWAPFFDPLWAMTCHAPAFRGSSARRSWHRSFATRASTTPRRSGDTGPARVWGSWRRRRSAPWDRSGSRESPSGSHSSSGMPWRLIMESIRRSLGLMTCGLVGPDVLSRWQLGPLSLRSPVFLVTAAFWIFIMGTANLLRLVGVVAALMRVYAPVVLVLLTATALWMLPGLADYRVEDAVVVARGSGPADGGMPSDSALSLFMGFFAMLGLLSVDWGAASARRRDVRVGGLAGIVLAGAWTATMALLVVAGAVGRARQGDPVWTEMAADPPPLSFRWGVIHGIGGYPASLILILFGLAALAARVLFHVGLLGAVRDPLAKGLTLHLDLDRGWDRSVADRAVLVEPAQHDRPDHGSALCTGRRCDDRGFPESARRLGRGASRPQPCRSPRLVGRPGTSRECGVHGEPQSGGSTFSIADPRIRDGCDSLRGAVPDRTGTRSDPARPVSRIPTLRVSTRSAPEVPTATPDPIELPVSEPTSPEPCRDG